MLGKRSCKSERDVSVLSLPSVKYWQSCGETSDLVVPVVCYYESLPLSGVLSLSPFFINQIYCYICSAHANEVTPSVETRH